MRALDRQRIEFSIAVKQTAADAGREPGHLAEIVGACKAVKSRRRAAGPRVPAPWNIHESVTTVFLSSFARPNVRPR
jgi:hypothetical protein